MNAEKPKYIDQLEAMLDRMALQLDKKRSWMQINCGYSGEMFAGVERAAQRLKHSAERMHEFATDYLNQTWLSEGERARE